MGGDARDTSPPPGYAVHLVTKVPNWHGLVVMDVLLNNLATGLFLCAAIAELLRPDTFGAIARVGYPVALVLLLADLLCLVLDLGDPLRFHHMLRVWKPSSPMSFGTWCLSAFALPLTILSLTSIWPGTSLSAGWVHCGLLLLGLPLALGSALYKGVLFSVSSQPGWREARWLSGYLVNSAFLLGTGMLLGLAVLLEATEAVPALRTAFAGLAILHLAALGILVWEIRHRLAEIRSRAQLMGLAAIVAGGTLLSVPLVLARSGVADLVALVALVGASLVARAELVFLPHRLRRPAAGPPGIGGTDGSRGGPD